MTNAQIIKKGKKHMYITFMKYVWQDTSNFTVCTNLTVLRAQIPESDGLVERSRQERVVDRGHVQADNPANNKLHKSTISRF